MRWIVHGTNDKNNRATITLMCASAEEAIAIAAKKGVKADRPPELRTEVEAVARTAFKTIAYIAGFIILAGALLKLAGLLKPLEELLEGTR